MSYLASTVLAPLHLPGSRNMLLTLRKSRLFKHDFPILYCNIYHNSLTARNQDLACVQIQENHKCKPSDQSITGTSVHVDRQAVLRLSSTQVRWVFMSKASNTCSPHHQILCSAWGESRLESMLDDNTVNDESQRKRLSVWDTHVPAAHDITLGHKRPNQV